ncbi:MAG: NTP transferase domain-containing protein [Bacteroidota bacterium]
MSKGRPHRKHAKLSRPTLGEFGRFEWSIVGMPSGEIQQLARELCDLLQSTHRMAYVDADHKSTDEAVAGEDLPETALGRGASMEVTDKIDFHRFDSKSTFDRYQFRQWFNGEDLILVNGNHFKAARQIVVIDPRQEKSLQGKLDRLTDVELLLLADEGLEVPEFLKEALPNWASLPCHAVKDVEAIAGFLRVRLEQLCPGLAGLVLAGGRSQRMGQDKGLLDYHGKPQRVHLLELLDQYCESVHLSVRPGQIVAIDIPALEDSFCNLGPYGAILSAFRQQPDYAWLVVAVDLPLLGPHALEQLLAARNPSKVATAFYNPETDFPEPLITIWEPRAYPILLQFLAQGHSCPRKVLIHSDIELVTLDDPAVLMNANRPEDVVLAKEKLQRK